MIVSHVCERARSPATLFDTLHIDLHFVARYFCSLFSCHLSYDVGRPATFNSVLHIEGTNCEMQSQFIYLMCVHAPGNAIKRRFRLIYPFGRDKIVCASPRT